MIKDLIRAVAPSLGNVMALAGLFAGVCAFADDPPVPPRILNEVGFDQKLDAQVPLDLPFVDEMGRTIKLGELFNEKPVILNLVYFECPMLCTQVLNGLLAGIQGLSFTAGQEYTIITVSFDPEETPALASAKKEAYLKKYGRPGAESGWHFLTGSQDSIKKLTDSVGFRYVYDDYSGEFAHASGIVLLTPKGKTARYFYGIEYPVKDLRFGLIEASQNRIGTPVDYLLLLCFHYDPLTGKYGFMIMSVLRILGSGMIVAIAAYILTMVRRERRRRSAEARLAETGPTRV